MSRSFNVMRVVAVSAALSAGIGEAACNEALADSQPSPVDLVRQIDKAHHIPFGSGTTFQRQLPHGEWAGVLVSSNFNKPKEIDSVELDVNIPKDAVVDKSEPSMSYLIPVVDISFTKQQNGTWSAVRAITDPVKPHFHFALNFGENSQTSVFSDTLTIAGTNKVITNTTEVESIKAANETLHQLEGQAEVLLQDILHGRAVSSTQFSQS